MPSVQRAYLDRLTFGGSQLAAIHRLGEARGRQDLFLRWYPEQLNTLRTHAQVESTESSNRIEGIVAGPGRVRDLVVRDTQPRDPVAGDLLLRPVVLPLAVLDFLCIHPFTDGNGRVARLLSLLLLYHFDYRVGRYISVERIIEESPDTYYEALETSSRGWHDNAHDAHPWLEYFWGVLIRAYDEFEERIASLKGSKTDQIRAAVGRHAGVFGIADIEHDAPGVSRDMVRHVLRQMREEGLVKVEGLGRGAKWRAVRP